MAAHCLVCARDLGPAVESCPRCQTRYHRDCLSYAGECAVYGCAPGQPASASKAHHVVLAYDDPGRMLMSWAAGMLGMVGLVSAGMGFLQGAMMMSAGLAAGVAASRIAAFRVVDPKSRTIWHHRRGITGESVEPELGFDDCRGLRLRKQFALNSAGENCRWVLDLVMEGGDRLILCDGISPDDANRVGAMLELPVERE